MLIIGVVGVICSPYGLQFSASLGYFSPHGDFLIHSPDSDT